MFGSLMILASGVLASSPSSAKASCCFCCGVRYSGNTAMTASGQRNIPQFNGHARRLGEGVDDRQERIGCQHRSFIGLRIDNLVCFCHGFPFLSDWLSKIARIIPRQSEPERGRVDGAHCKGEVKQVERENPLSLRKTAIYELPSTLVVAPVALLSSDCLPSRSQRSPTQYASDPGDG